MKFMRQIQYLMALVLMLIVNTALLKAMDGEFANTFEQLDRDAAAKAQQAESSALLKKNMKGKAAPEIPTIKPKIAVPPTPVEQTAEEKVAEATKRLEAANTKLTNAKKTLSPNVGSAGYKDSQAAIVKQEDAYAEVLRRDKELQAAKEAAEKETSEDKAIILAKRKLQMARRKLKHAQAKGGANDTQLTEEVKQAEEGLKQANKAKDDQESAAQIAQFDRAHAPEEKDELSINVGSPFEKPELTRAEKRAAKEKEAEDKQTFGEPVEKKPLTRGQKAARVVGTVGVVGAGAYGIDEATKK